MSVRTFTKAPSTGPLMLKAVLPTLPVVGNLPGVKHVTDGVSDLVVRFDGLKTDKAHLAKYRAITGFASTDHLPATYPHNAGMPLQLVLLTDPSFVFSPMGVVHLRNTITQHRPIGVDEVYDLEVKAANLRPHRTGRLIDVLTTATIGGEVVWEGVSTYLARGKGKGTEPTPAPLEGVEAPEGVVRWKLEGNLGRRFASISGDRNPIHLYPLTAKAFGFPSNIAHGAWTMARSLGALENRLPDAYTVDIEFRKPILLPGTVVFGSRTDGGVITFGVVGSKKPSAHLVGRVTAH